MSKHRIFFILTLDDDHPTGGVRQAYRQVDLLNEMGYDAFVVVGREDFRCTWFENTTRVVGRDSVSLCDGDYVVVSEIISGLPKISGIDKASVIVYAQNPFGVLRGFGGISESDNFYRDRVCAVMCVSEHSERVLRVVLPHTPIYRIRYSFDKPPFGLGEHKERLIAYMARRSRESIEEVLTMLATRGMLNDWTVKSIDGESESSVSKIMKRAAIFIAGGYREGFGMPPAEAMASGCYVVGWPGVAGWEFMHPSVSSPIRETDTLSCFLEMSRLVKLPMEDLQSLGRRASQVIRREYSTEREKDSIAGAWTKIIRESSSSLPSAPITSVSLASSPSDGFSIFPLSRVAAFISTYDEGPYLESILRWLSTRVGCIYVVESKSAFYGGRSSSLRRTKSIVDMVMANGAGNIKYLELEGNPHPGPDIKEAHERNQALEIIEKDGFEWVWVVDADEIYTDREAEFLWSWFLSEYKSHSDIVGARCSWYTYWRSLHWRVDPPESFHPNVILKPSCRIHSSRHTSDEGHIVQVPENVCMVRHYSWAKSPRDAEQKIKTWTHGHQVIHGWFENTFMKWTPGSSLENFGPTVAEAYRRLVPCDLPIPEALVNHPYVGQKVIGDDNKPKRIKAVILNHNAPQNSDRLYEKLVGVFDDVEIFDSGSDTSGVASHTTRKFENIYWSGCWNEIMATCSDYDAVWMIGDDIELLSKPEEYRVAIEQSLPFGCWSPCVRGRAKPFMQEEYYRHGNPVVVKNMEGMSMAVSGELMSEIVKLPDGSMGYGQDLWLCYRARKRGFKNVIDGRVRVYHPEGIRYDDSKWVQQMEDTFGRLYGHDFRWTVFEYDDRYEENKMKEGPKKKPFTIATVDNGWSYPDFIKITHMFPDAKKIIMVKGVGEIPPHRGVEVIRYDKSLTRILSEADAVLFPKVGAATKVDFVRLLESGIPVVVHSDYHLGLIKHMDNGFIYQVEAWAHNWLTQIRDNPQIAQKIQAHWRGKSQSDNARVVENEIQNPSDKNDKAPLAESNIDKNVETKTIVDGIAAVISPIPAEVLQGVEIVHAKKPLVSVITPTFGRDPKTIRRCIDSIRLQTVDNWEQLVCSNGREEPLVRSLIETIGDPRVKYHFIAGGVKEGDFGNSSRKKMIELASGECIMFCDDDNIILPTYMEKMLKSLNGNGDIGFSVCEIMHFGPLNEAEVGKPPAILKGEPVKLYHIDPLQVMVRSDLMKRVGWDTQVGYLSDGVTLEKLGNEAKHVRVAEILGIHL